MIVDKVSEDRTSYATSLTHMIKGNLGAGLLGMGSSFKHLGLVGALISLPALCIISGYCAHLLIRSARLVESKTGRARSGVDYTNLTRESLGLGPKWAQILAKPLSRLVDAALLFTQIGICCVYIVFVVDNITSILSTYDIKLSKAMAFAAVLPFALLLSFIRTLRRLAVASTIANLLQFVGLALIIEYLLRDFSNVSIAGRDKFRPISEMALGFGSTMFAFEGISVVLPIYSRLNKPKLMANHTCGVINMSYLIIVTLYFAIGLLSFLKYGRDVQDSITLNLPAEPLYDGVRAMFTGSILLTYPLQCYVANEMIWKWVRKNLLSPPLPPITIASEVLKQPGTDDKKSVEYASHTIDLKVAKTVVSNRLEDGSKPAGQFGATSFNMAKDKEIGNFGKFVSIGAIDKSRPIDDKLFKSSEMTAQTTAPENNYKSLNKSDQYSCGQTSTEQSVDSSSDDIELEDEAGYLKYEYGTRIAVVLLIFMLSISVPKLNLLMDLIGSFSGVALCLTIPALIHMAVYWDSERGFRKCIIIILDTIIIFASLAAGTGGSLSSMVSLVTGH